MKHTCSTLVLQCMDFRFIDDIGMFLESMDLKGDYDLVSLAGAQKNIAEPYDAHAAELVYRQVEISKKLHGTEQVMLLAHMDCGAYGGSKAFVSKDEERARYLKDLAHAASHITKRIEGVSVIKVLARIDDVGKVDFEKVA